MAAQKAINEVFGEFEVQEETPEQVQARILTDILLAESDDQVLAAAELPSLEDLADKVIKIRDVKPMYGDLGLFLVIDALDAQGQPFKFSAGGLVVVAQIANLLKRESIDPEKGKTIEARVAEITTQRGYTTYRLVRP